MFGLQSPRFVVPDTAGKIGSKDTFGGGVPDQAINAGIRKTRTATGAITTFIQQPGNRLLALMFGKKFIHELPHRAFLQMRLEFLVFPDVAERSFSVQRLSKFRPDCHRCLYPVADLFAFPLGHDSNHVVEKTSRRSTGVDVFL